MGLLLLFQKVKKEILFYSIGLTSKEFLKLLYRKWRRLISKTPIFYTDIKRLLKN